MKKIAVVFLFFFVYFPFAQMGENVYTFLNIPSNARQASLGGDAISIRDNDVSQSINTPSLMNLEMSNHISANYSSYIADTHFGTIAYAHDLGRGHLVGVNLRYLNYGSMLRTDEGGNVLGDFSASDASFGLGYAYQIDDDWTIGGGMSLISSKIDVYHSMAAAGLASVTYYREQNKESISIVARNFGYQFRAYNGFRENLPFRIDAGYTKILDTYPMMVSITAHDLQKFDISQKKDNNEQNVSNLRKIADHFSFGLELFPEQSFNIRLGYNLKRGNELAVLDQRNFTGLSFGFGLKVSYFKFDYAHLRYHNASNMHMFGISLDLNRR